MHSAPGSGDGWVEDGSGAKFWGRFGAAGLLAYDPARGILLQHRANWSHFGGTWGLPGGARHESETPVQGAIREASEEAGVVVEALSLTLTSTFDLGFWSYTTVVVDVTSPFEAAATDAESIEVRWVPVAEVAALPLHPGFGASWPTLQAELGRRTVLIVDSANVVGSRPDGWWKDRAAATERLAERLARLSSSGFAAAALGIDLPGTHWWPEVRLVVEGAARAARLPAAAAPPPAAHAAPASAVPSRTPAPAAARDAAAPPSLDAGTQPADAHLTGTRAADIAARLTLVAAEHDGDQAIVDEVAALFAAPRPGTPPLPPPTAD
ncbi:NUDIX domain-containing protein, partial [Subtercola sp. Z020]|uniref:NUDIX domain-containing protein n=1 Tax=Subtercola sp. Z020 TaxID=2080582 RepID=UPI001E5AB2B4